jgi:hypothetical protein
MVTAIGMVCFVLSRTSSLVALDCNVLPGYDVCGDWRCCVVGVGEAVGDVKGMSECHHMKIP